MWRTAPRAIKTQTGDIFRDLAGNDPYPTIVSPDHILPGAKDRIARLERKAHEPSIAQRFADLQKQAEDRPRVPLELSREEVQLVRDYIAAADALPRPKRDNARIVLTGAFCEQPPLALIKSIEMSGCYVVDDDFMLVTRWLQGDVPADADPLDELSKAFLHRSASTAAKYENTREEKGVFLLKQVKSRGAEGVIFAAPSFCDPALLERPMLQDVLAKQKVPYTAFKYAENTGQMAPIREQASIEAAAAGIIGR